jgi:hypothetical protein
MKFLSHVLGPALGGLDAVRLPIIFIGLVSLGVIRIGFLVLKHLGQKR